MNKEIDSIVYPGWRVIRKIGAGSYGSVYEIERDLFGTIEKAALKVISIPRDSGELDELYSSGYDDASITDHFKDHLAQIVREYSIMTDLKGHTNIVCCNDVNFIQHDDGIGWDIFIRMELLTPILKTQNLLGSEAQIIKLGKDLCRALIVCREKDIIHRDIKPQNVFVSDTGDFKLGDFGIAKTMEQTMGATKIGTYAYMAPEVYHNRPYGAAADIYSLGLILYWLLNDRRLPFLPMPPKMPTLEEYETGRLRRLSGEAIPQPRRGSPALRQIVLKACSFDPFARYQSAQEMLAELEALEDLPHSAGYPEDDDKTVAVFKKQPAPSRAAVSAEAESGKTEYLFPGRPAPSQTTSPRPPKQPAPPPPANKTAVNPPIYSGSGNRRPSRKWGVLIAVICALLILIAALLIWLIPRFAENLSAENERPAYRHEDTDEEEQTEAPEDEATDIPPTDPPLSEADLAKEQARVLYSQGAYRTAAQKISEIPQYYEHDALRLLYADCCRALATNTIAAGGGQSVWIYPDNTVSGCGENQYGQINVSGWTEVISVATGDFHTVGLRSDGTVYATGSNQKGQCEVSGWTDITVICAGDYHTIGLREDGMLMAAGNNGSGQCNVNNLMGSTDIVSVSAGNEHTVALMADGTVSAIGSNKYGQCDVAGWTDIVAVFAGTDHTVGLKTDGTVVAAGRNDYSQCLLSGWTDIERISAGDFFSMGITSDGRVVSAGHNNYGQSDVSGWNDIVAIGCGGRHSIGLKSDGTLVSAGTNAEGQLPKNISIYSSLAAPPEEPKTGIVAIATGGWGSYALSADGTVYANGRNHHGQCNVGSWENVIDLSGGDCYVVGLKSDGTVVHAGRNHYNQGDLSSWQDIKAVSAGTYHTVGLTFQGTVLAQGRNTEGQCDVSGWTDVIQADAGELHTVAVRSDGTVMAVGSNSHGQCDVSSWTDIIAVSAGQYHTIGLKKDGTVVAAGSNEYGQRNVSGWTDITAICTGDNFSVGLKSDGTVVAVGYNQNKQCNVGAWTDIVKISAGYGHTMGLTKYGTVVAVGWNYYGQLDVSGWS